MCVPPQQFPLFDPRSSDRRLVILIPAVFVRVQKWEDIVTSCLDLSVPSTSPPRIHSDSPGRRAPLPLTDPSLPTLSHLASPASKPRDHFSLPIFCMLVYKPFIHTPNLHIRHTLVFLRLFGCGPYVFRTEVGFDVSLLLKEKGQKKLTTSCKTSVVDFLRYPFFVLLQPTVSIQHRKPSASRRVPSLPGRHL